MKDIATKIPATTIFLDDTFSPERIVPRLNEFDIVHLATHATFVSGDPEESFVLFGNGDRVTLPELRDWMLDNASLVVLSACQTGVGGRLGNGEEILGLGYQIQRAGARATIASLWIVSDNGTQVLMERLYEYLARGMPEAEALQQAQIDLIESGSPFDHPFFWGSFVLIGNGL